MGQEDFPTFFATQIGAKICGNFENLRTKQKIGGPTREKKGENERFPEGNSNETCCAHT